MNHKVIFLFFMMLSSVVWASSNMQTKHLPDNTAGPDMTIKEDEFIPKDAPEKLVRLMNELAANETNPLLKKHFQSIDLLTMDTTHGVKISEDDIKEANQVIKFFKSDGVKWETYVIGPRPLIMSFISPTDGKISYYKLFLPKNFDEKHDNYPLYFELHGSGGGKNNNPRRQVFMSLKPEVQGVTSQGYRKEGFLVYPWGRGDRGYRDIAETDVFEVLNHFDNMFKTDAKRQYIFGFSMGGGGTFKIATKTIERWTAVGIYSGAFRNATAEQVEIFKNTPVWMAWGDSERLTETCRKLKDLFIEAGVDLKWIEVKNTGHQYLSEYQEDLMDWFKTKVKE